MNEKEAINVLVQAAEFGQKAGAYTIKDSALIYAAIRVLLPNYFNEKEEKGDEPQEKKENL